MKNFSPMLQRATFKVLLIVLIFSVLSCGPSSDKYLSEIESLARQSKWEGVQKQLKTLDSLQLEYDEYRLIASILQNVVKTAQYERINKTPAEVFANYENNIAIFSVKDSILSNDFQNFAKIRLNPYINITDLCNLFLEYGDLLERLKKNDEAGIYFERAALINNNNTDVLKKLGDRNKNMHEWDAAAKMYNQYIEKMNANGQSKNIDENVISFIESGNYGPQLRKKIYECMIESAPDNLLYYMENIEEDFNEPTVTIHGAPVSGAELGHNGYIYGDNLYANEFEGAMGCFKSLLSLSGDFESAFHGFEKLTQIKATSEDNPNFSYINPEAITWARKNMLPNPEETILGNSAQSLYNVFLRPECRSKAVALLFLKRFFSIPTEAGLYESAMGQDDFYGPGYLYDNFYLLQNKFLGEKYYIDTEIGFWLRRYLDGSFWEAKKTLDVVIEDYDLEWYDEISNHFMQDFGAIENYLPAETGAIQISHPDFQIEISIMPVYDYTVETLENEILISVQVSAFDAPVIDHITVLPANSGTSITGLQQQYVISIFEDERDVDPNATKAGEPLNSRWKICESENRFHFVTFQEDNFEEMPEFSQGEIENYIRDNIVPDSGSPTITQNISDINFKIIWEDEGGEHETLIHFSVTYVF